MTAHTSRYASLEQPWALTPEGFDGLRKVPFAQTVNVTLSMAEIKALWCGASLEAVQAGAYRSGEDVLDRTSAGVAIIPVAGALTQQSYWRGDRASYDWIAAQLALAVSDPGIQAIMLNVNSPGGQLAGVEGLSRAIYDAREQKPVHAFVSGQAASAAYWLASATEEITATRTSMLGSIGVIMSYIDCSRMDEQMGIQQIDVVSSQSPDKATDPTTKEGRARVQALVDQLAGVFVADVARNRGVSEATVLSDFGRGWVIVGAAAVDVGLADRVGTLDSAIEAVVSDDSAGSIIMFASREQEQEEESDMTRIAIADVTLAMLEAEAPALLVEARTGYVLVTAAADTQETAIQAAVAAAMAEVRTLAPTADQTQALLDDERTRVLGIQTAAQGAGLDTLVAELVANSSITLDAAKARLFEALQAKRTGRMDALRGDETELDNPGPGGSDDENASAEADADMLKAATGYAARVSPSFGAPGSGS